MDWLRRFLWKPFHLLWSVVLIFFSFFMFYSTGTFSARSGLRLISNFNSQVSYFFRRNWTLLVRYEHSFFVFSAKPDSVEATKWSSHLLKSIMELSGAMRRRQVKVIGIFRCQGMQVFVLALVYSLFESFFQFFVCLKRVPHLFKQSELIH